MNGRLVCDEGEPFMVVNEGYKLLEGNVVTATHGIILQAENRISVPGAESSPVCQEVVGKLEMTGSERENVVRSRQDASSNIVSLLAREEAKDELVKKSVYSAAAGCYGDGSVLVSERRIEITGYCHKDVGAVIEEDRRAEKDDTPPPLPLTGKILHPRPVSLPRTVFPNSLFSFSTGPPKIDRAVCPTSYAARNAAPLLDSTPRKFTSNGELWRQDDKSERSVRDKIAMFSSQSSLDGPLFPSASMIAAAATSRRLSKYKSTEDVCSDERHCGQKERVSFLGDRTQSSFDLTDSGRNVGQEPGRRYNRQGSPFNAVGASRTLASVAQRGGAGFEASTPPPKSAANSYSVSGQNCPTKAGLASAALSRATSFSGSSSAYGHQDRASAAADLAPTLAISRTSSLASTFKRPAEDSLRRNSLNQLIEQRKRSISKLRGLVIPEKETITIDAPIVDLPEIKSRDSILLHQVSTERARSKRKMCERTRCVVHRCCQRRAFRTSGARKARWRATPARPACLRGARLPSRCPPPKYTPSTRPPSRGRA